MEKESTYFPLYCIDLLLQLKKLALFITWPWSFARDWADFCSLFLLLHMTEKRWLFIISLRVQEITIQYKLKGTFKSLIIDHLLLAGSWNDRAFLVSSQYSRLVFSTPPDFGCGSSTHSSSRFGESGFGHMIKGWVVTRFSYYPCVPLQPPCSSVRPCFPMQGCPCLLGVI